MQNFIHIAPMVSSADACLVYSAIFCFQRSFAALMESSENR